MYFSYNASSMWFPDLLLYFKLVSNAPYGGEFPAIMIFDLLAQTLNMHINMYGYLQYTHIPRFDPKAALL